MQLTLGGSILDAIYTTVGGTLIFRKSSQVIVTVDDDSDFVADKYLEFSQPTPATKWVIDHLTFDKIPSINVFDLAGNEIIPEIQSSSKTQTTLMFNPAAAGKAILN